MFMQVQVRKAMRDIYRDYGNEIGSITVCGHSLVRPLEPLTSSAKP